MQTKLSPDTGRSSHSAVRHDIPWRERPLLSMQTAAAIAGMSTASLYSYAAKGRLTLKRLGGRVFVETESLKAFLNSAEPWTSSRKPVEAIAARRARTAAGWRGA